MSDTVSADDINVSNVVEIEDAHHFLFVFHID